MFWFVLDTSEIAGRYRDAQSLEAAEMQLASLNRQVTELKALLDQGIVSRNEYDGLVQQRDSQANAVAGARDELASTQTRGNDENRQLVVLDLENAKAASTT